VSIDRPPVAGDREAFPTPQRLIMRAMSKRERILFPICTKFFLNLFETDPKVFPKRELKVGDGI
jgi:hypothetical protein